MGVTMRNRIVTGELFRLGIFLVLLLVLSTIFSTSLAQEQQSATRAELEKVANSSTVEIITIGRKSGKPHTKPIWFVYEQGHFYLQSGKEGKTDWYQNLRKNPQVTLKIDTLTLNGTAKFITDPKEAERIHGLFRSKYLTARMAGMVGSSIGHGEVVEVEFAE
jgi:deazaflavin-dependent oxidoreductase (nitroreductase family)